jgi:Phage tail assembly chaperone protein, TAC
VGDSFAATAARVAGLAGALLGWRPDEFWAATPAELGTVLRAFAPDVAEPPSANDLTRLKERFPDG